MPAESTRVQALFLAAVEVPDAAARDAYLGRECGADADLRARVESLLHAHDEPGGLSPGRGPANRLSVFFPPAQGFRGTATPWDHLPPPAAGHVVAGRYRLVTVIGEGSMGTVYRADQTAPVTRPVALKLVKTGPASAVAMAWFDAERQALARMDHPNIAKVFDGGTTAAGQPFFVMELVNGVPITEFCDRRTMPVRDRLALFALVCQAVQHAHQKGIIHRDLKPGNVLVTEVDGVPTPKVIDFGVAKATEQRLDDGTFVDLAVVGTPAYMSPEQADPAGDIDTRTDVYALGVLLYELLVGSPPLDAAHRRRGTVLETLRLVRESDPPRPSVKLNTSANPAEIAANRAAGPGQLTRALRTDLDWVVMKALEKDRGRRYDSAAAFAADVHRCLAHEPVLAAPPGCAYRARKFVRKNRGAVTAAGLVGAALLAGLAGTTWGLVRAQRARDAEAARVTERDAALVAAAAALGRESSRVEERDAAVAAATGRAADLKHQLGVSNMVLAKSAYDGRDVTLAAERLDAVPPEQRGWEWRFTKRQTDGGLFTVAGHRGGVTGVACSPDGAQFATASADGTVKVWDARTGMPLMELPGHPGGVLGVAYSPDGRRVVTGGADRTAKLWDARIGRLLRTFTGHADAVQGVAVSPDGRRVATGSRDGTAKVWDAAAGEPLAAFAGHPDGRNGGGGVLGVAFSPDGSRVVTGGSDATAKVWDAATGRPVITLAGHGGWVYGVAFGPDGSHIVTAGHDKTAKVWDARTGKRLTDLKGHTEVVASVAFSPDGSRVVTGSRDRTAKVWDANAGTLLVDLAGHRGTVAAVAFSPDGARVVSGGDDGAAKVWDARTAIPRVELRGHAGYVMAVAVSPDGTRIATGGSDGVLNVWDAETGALLLTMPTARGFVQSVAFSPDGARVVTGNHDKTAKIWDARSGDLLTELKGHTDAVWCAAFSPDGGRVVTGSWDATARVWDARAGTPLAEFTGHAAKVYGVAFSPDGSRVVSGAWDATAKVWDARTGNLVQDFKGHTQIVLSVAFGPDGTRIVTGGHDGTAKVWDARTGKIVADMKGHSSLVWSVAVSPDGARVVTGSQDGTARVWDARTGTPLAELNGRSRWVYGVAVSPDGSRIVVGGADDSAEVWDARPADAAALLFHTRSDAWRCQDGYEAARKAGDRFAGRFYLDRLLSVPGRRTAARLKERNDLEADPRVTARTGFHCPELANEPFDRGVVRVMAAAGDRLAQRLMGQDALRDGRPGAAVPWLYLSLLARPAADPPVEELLLAQAFLRLNRPEEARRLHRAAVGWLDGPGENIRVANVLTFSILKSFAGLASAFAPVPDPRRNPFNWEAWHECDVIRHAVEPQLTSRFDR